MNDTPILSSSHASPEHGAGKNTVLRGAPSAFYESLAALVLPLIERTIADYHEGGTA